MSNEKSTPGNSEQRPTPSVVIDLAEASSSEKTSSADHLGSTRTQEGSFGSPPITKKPCSSPSLVVVVGQASTETKQEKGNEKADAEAAIKIRHGDTAKERHGDDETSCRTEQQSPCQRCGKKRKHSDAIKMQSITCEESQQESSSKKQNGLIGSQKEVDSVLDPFVVVKWILATDKPLRDSQDPRFQEMMKAASGASCPGLDEVHAELDRMKMWSLEATKKLLKDAEFFVATDIWTAANKKSFIALSVTFLERSGAALKVRRLPLECAEIERKDKRGEDTGVADVKARVLELLKGAGLDPTKCLGVTSDIFSECQELEPGSSLSTQACLAHVLELTARVFTGDVVDGKTVKLTLHRDEPKRSAKSDLTPEAFGRRVSLRKCALMVRFFVEHPKDVEELKGFALRKEIQATPAFKAPLGTGWWTDVEMCKSILSSRELLEAAMEEDIVPPYLKEVDWDAVEEIVALLQPLQDALKVIEEDRCDLLRSSVPTLVYALRNEIRRIQRDHRLERVRKTAKVFLDAFDDRFNDCSEEVGKEKKPDRRRGFARSVADPGEPVALENERWTINPFKNKPKVPALMMTKERFYGAFLDPRLKHLPKVPRAIKGEVTAEIEVDCVGMMCRKAEALLDAELEASAKGDSANGPHGSSGKGAGGSSGPTKAAVCKEGSSSFIEAMYDSDGSEELPWYGRKKDTDPAEGRKQRLDAWKRQYESQAWREVQEYDTMSRATMDTDPFEWWSAAGDLPLLREMAERCLIVPGTSGSSDRCLEEAGSGGSARRREWSKLEGDRVAQYVVVQEAIAAGLMEDYRREPGQGVERDAESTGRGAPHATGSRAVA